MNFKRWLKEEKGGGGFGAFLIIVIIASSIYAVQFGPSNLFYEPESAFAEAIYIPTEESYEAESQNYGRDSATLHNSGNNYSDQVEGTNSDTLAMTQAEELASRNEPEVTSTFRNKTELKNTTKPKAKPKAKPKRNRLSREELVKRKLDQGKTVKQIADETGLDKKYIREVKRRTQQVVW